MIGYSGLQCRDCAERGIRATLAGFHASAPDQRAGPDALRRGASMDGIETSK